MPDTPDRKQDAPEQPLNSPQNLAGERSDRQNLAGAREGDKPDRESETPQSGKDDQRGVPDKSDMGSSGGLSGGSGTPGGGMSKRR